MVTIGMVHPGAMGAAVGGLLVGAGHDVVWAGSDRSSATYERATAAGLRDVGTLADLAGADVVVSLCPPAAAADVAARVGHAVDGSVVGGPPRSGDEHPTRLYLSGEEASTIADLFDDDALEVVVLDAPVGAASAVKMAFAGWTKATAALAVALRAMARAEGVEDAVLAEWDRSLPGVSERSGRTAPLAAKAWRFAGELREIGDAMAADGLPSGFHHAAAEVYDALADLRDHPDPDVDDLLSRLLPPP